MSLDVLVLTDADDFESALPALTSFSQTLRCMPLTDHADSVVLVTRASGLRIQR